MLLGRDHPRDRERRQRLRLVLDVLDLEPDHGELAGELFQRLVGVEMFLQPGEREFHDDGFSCPLSRLRGRVRVGALSAMGAAIVSRTPARFVITSWLPKRRTLKPCASIAADRAASACSAWSEKCCPPSSSMTSFPACSEILG